jgi:hypothetical protein
MSPNIFIVFSPCLVIMALLYLPLDRSGGTNPTEDLFSVATGLALRAVPTSGAGLTPQ